MVAPLDAVLFSVFAVAVKQQVEFVRDAE